MLNALDKAGNQFGFFSFILIPNRLSFSFADTLDDHLFRGLRGNAAEIGFCLKSKLQFVINFRVFFNLHCFIQHYVPLGIKTDFAVAFRQIFFPPGKAG